MARTKTVAPKVLTAKEQEIASLRKRLREIRDEGSFRAAAKKLKEGIVSIRKDKTLNDEGRREALDTLMEDVSDSMSE